MNCSQFSSEQIEEMKEAFFTKDQSSDHHIESNKLGEIFRSLGWNMSENELTDMIYAIDPNNDGFIDFPTFLSMMGSRCSLCCKEEEELYQELKDLDKGGDGLIELNSIRQLMATKYSLSFEEIDEGIREVEVNSDNKINLEEFYKVMMAK